MKKIFTFVAVLLLAVSANATVLWSENFGALATQQNNYWPYAGGDPAKNYVYTDYSNQYDSVCSYSVSVRAKAVGSDLQTKYNGFYFAKGKTHDKNYVSLNKEAGLVSSGKGMFFCFDFMTDQADSVNLNNFVLKINGNQVTVPTGIKTSAKYYTTTASIAIPDGDVKNIYMAFDNNSAQVFMLNIKITDEPTAIPEVLAEKSFNKAVKMIENGRVVIIRNGMKYNAVGGVIE